jgi:hypothetical protein
MIPVTLLASRIGRGGRPFLLLLVLLTIQRRDGISLMLRVGVLGRSSGERTMFGREVQEILLCRMVGEGVF